ncbi:MAG: hypothetical protein GXO79_04390 [Chlorobi bacterium]|nr:hypothetical protein [Chlorobiota bacterium]
MNTIFQPKYRTYSNRIFHSLKRVSIILIALVLIGLISNLYLVIFVFLMLIILTLYSIIQNKEYIEKIEINEELKTIKIKTRTKDYENVEKEYSINEIDIIIKKTYVVYPTFILEIFSNKNRILKQKTLGEWNTDYFINILKKVNELKGKKTYIDYVKHN